MYNPEREKEKLIMQLIRQGYTPDQAIDEVESFPIEAELLAQQRDDLIKNKKHNVKRRTETAKAKVKGNASESSYPLFPTA